MAAPGDRRTGADVPWFVSRHYRIHARSAGLADQHRHHSQRAPTKSIPVLVSKTTQTSTDGCAQVGKTGLREGAHELGQGMWQSLFLL